MEYIKNGTRSISTCEAAREHVIPYSVDNVNSKNLVYSICDVAETQTQLFCHETPPTMIWKRRIPDYIRKPRTVTTPKWHIPSSSSGSTSAQFRRMLSPSAFRVQRKYRTNGLCAVCKSKEAAFGSVVWHAK